MFKMIYQQEKTSLLQNFIFFNGTSDWRNRTILMIEEGVWLNHIVTVPAMAVS